jgi:hypothetical protein
MDYLAIAVPQREYSVTGFRPPERGLFLIGYAFGGELVEHITQLLAPIHLGLDVVDLGQGGDWCIDRS